MTWYALVKDFAGPVATVIAASAAAYVTIIIQKQNHSVARDRLKLDLFESDMKFIQQHVSGRVVVRHDRHGATADSEYAANNGVPRLMHGGMANIVDHEAHPFDHAATARRRLLSCCSSSPVIADG